MVKVTLLADFDVAGAVGDRGAVERIDRAVVGRDLAEAAVLVERRHDRSPTRRRTQHVLSG